MPSMVVANSDNITLYNTGFTRYAWNLLYGVILLGGVASFGLVLAAIGQTSMEEVGLTWMGYAGLVYGIFILIASVAIASTVESKILHRQLTKVLTDTLGYTNVTLRHYNTFYALDSLDERAKFMLVRVSRTTEKLSGRGAMIDTYRFLHLDMQ